MLVESRRRDAVCLATMRFVFAALRSARESIENKKEFFMYKILQEKDFELRPGGTVRFEGESSWLWRIVLSRQIRTGQGIFFAQTSLP